MVSLSDERIIICDTRIIKKLEIKKKALGCGDDGRVGLKGRIVIPEMVAPRNTQVTIVFLNE